MTDLLIRRLTEPPFGTETSERNLMAEAARALLDARAELDTTQTQVGDWIVRADEAKVKVEKLEAELARVRADAAVAVALMVERAAEQADPWDGPVTKNKIVDAQAIVAQQVKARIRALAPDAGTAELAKLRERAEKAEQERVAEWNRRRDADGSRDAARAACDTMRAERDTLAASPEVAKRVADAEARGMERAAEILAVRADVLLVDAGADAELVRVLDASVAAIRTAATSLRTGEAG